MQLISSCIMDLNNQKFVGEGLTYDDVLLVPAYSEILPREVNIKSKFQSQFISCVEYHVQL